MNLSKRLLMTLFSLMAVIGLQACESSGDGAFENAGEEIDQGVENTAEALDEAEDEIDEEF